MLGGSQDIDNAPVFFSDLSRFFPGILKEFNLFRDFGGLYRSEKLTNIWRFLCKSQETTHMNLGNYIGEVRTYVDDSISGWWCGTMEFYDFPFSWEFHIPN